MALLTWLYSGLLLLTEIDWKIKTMTSIYFAVFLSLSSLLICTVNLYVHTIHCQILGLIIAVLSANWMCLFYSSGGLTQCFGNYYHHDTENWYYPRQINIADVYMFFTYVAYLRISIQELSDVRDYII